MTRRFSPPFARLIAQQQAHEGELRHCHARLVAHAEEVALPEDPHPNPNPSPNPNPNPSPSPNPNPNPNPKPNPNPNPNPGQVALLEGGPRERGLLDAALERTASFSRRYYLLQFAQGAVDQARRPCACVHR